MVRETEDKISRYFVAQCVPKGSHKCPHGEEAYQGVLVAVDPHDLAHQRTVGLCVVQASGVKHLADKTKWKSIEVKHCEDIE
jgi:hypothetical protein